MNEIMALPAGMRYRNRFDALWIAPQLRNDIQSLLGSAVLITLRDPDNNKLIPVRWGKIVTVQPVGRIVYFEYHLGDLVEYSTAENVRQQEVIDHTATFAAQHNWLPGAAGQPMQDASVFRSTVGNGFNRVDSSDLTAWGNAISAIATAPVYEGIEFLKVVGLFGPDGKAAGVRAESFLVQSNTVYSLRVFQHVPRPGVGTIPSHSIEVNTFDAHVTALRSRQQAVGKYDMLTFVLRVLHLSPGERTSMEIPHRPDAATTNNALTSLYLPLTVTNPEPARFIAMLCLILACAALMFWPHVGRLPEDVVRNVATVIFVLTLTGPTRTLSTVWPSWPWGGSR
ncbi:hypothetical protein [Streptomyces sp. NPDC049813]|uniref:hypothetical protein n=1 Tax=Streptomyces sp. NPDC049813 TaxID=3365597 RepID=UPI0037A4CC98